MRNIKKLCKVLPRKKYITLATYNLLKKSWKNHWHISSISSKTYRNPEFPWLKLFPLSCMLCGSLSWVQHITYLSMTWNWRDHAFMNFTSALGLCFDEYRHGKIFQRTWVLYPILLSKTIFSLHELQSGDFSIGVDVRENFSWTSEEVT